MISNFLEDHKFSIDLKRLNLKLKLGTNLSKLLSLLRIQIWAHWQNFGCWVWLDYCSVERVLEIGCLVWNQCYLALDCQDHSHLLHQGVLLASGGHLRKPLCHLGMSRFHKISCSTPISHFLKNTWKMTLFYNSEHFFKHWCELSLHLFIFHSKILRGDYVCYSKCYVLGWEVISVLKTDPSLGRALTVYIMIQGDLRKHSITERTISTNLE